MPNCRRREDERTPRFDDDADLREGFAERRADVTERLVRAYQGRLYAFALRLLGNAADAEEVVQDVFVRAHYALTSQYAPDRVRALALRPWLYRIALNLVRNRRRGARVAPISLDASAGDGPELHPRVGTQIAGARARASSNPAAVAEERERAEALAAALLRLPARQREAVVLRYVQGVTYAEAAAAAGRPVGTVKSDAHRGLERLARLLESEATTAEVTE